MFKSIESLSTESADKWKSAVEGEDLDLEHDVRDLELPRVMSCSSLKLFEDMLYVGYA